MDDALETNATEVTAELQVSESCDSDRLIIEAIRASDQKRIPHQLFARLARRKEEALQYCIRRMNDPGLGRSEEASLALLLQRTGWLKDLLDALLHADKQVAATVAGVLERSERGLDLKLAVHLQSEDASVVMRSLELIEVIGKSRQMVPVLFGLLSHDDPRIQSKAALVVEKLDHDFLYTRQLMRHSDARVRANALQAISDRADPRTMEFLRQGAEDADHRVRSLAAVGLCRIGDPLGWETLFKMIQDPRVSERRSAAWALGRCGTIESLPRLEGVLRDDGDERVRSLAAQSIQRIRERAAMPNTEAARQDSV